MLPSGSTKGEIMKQLLFALGAFALMAGTVNAGTFEGSTTVRTEIVEHGGGCRKSSPPGQCCHLETRTGIVHCH